MPWKILSDPWEAGGGVPDGLGTLALPFPPRLLEPFSTLFFFLTHTRSLFYIL